MLEKTNTSGLPEFISPKELAKALKMPVTTVRTASWQRQTGLNPFRFGRQLRFDLVDVRAMLVRNQVDRNLEK